MHRPGREPHGNRSAALELRPAPHSVGLVIAQAPANAYPDPMAKHFLLRVALVGWLVATSQAAAPVTKTGTKSFDLYDEVKAYLGQLVASDKQVAAQWQARGAAARQRTGRISNGPWVPLQ